MNSEDLKILGKAVKLKHPEYAGYSDEDIGRLVHQKYPQYIEHGSPAPSSLTPSEVKTMTKQAESLASYTAYQTQRTMAMQALNAQQDLQPTRDANLAQLENTTTVLKEASASKLDPVSYAQDMLAENSHLRELRKAKEMAQLTVDAILTENMFDKEKTAALQTKIFKQVDVIEGLHKLPPSPGREEKLKWAKAILAQWTAELENGVDDEGAKGPVPSQDRNKPRGLVPAAEPPTSSQEDD